MRLFSAGIVLSLALSACQQGVEIAAQQESLEQPATRAVMADETANLVDGDMIFTTAAERGEGPEVQSTLGTGVGLWAGGVVSYKISSGLSSAMRAKIDKAIIAWNATGVITWKEASSKDAYVVTFKSKGSSCSCGSATVGRSKSGTIEVGSGASYDIVLHEMGHAIGLKHEQIRIDQAMYMSVTVAKSDQEKATGLREATPLTPYDYASLMHYDLSSSFKFTIPAARLEMYKAQIIAALNQPGQDKFSTVFSASKDYIGDLPVISEYDRAGVQWLYSAPKVKINFSVVNEAAVRSQLNVSSTDTLVRITMLNESATIAGWSMNLELSGGASIKQGVASSAGIDGAMRTTEVYNASSSATIINPKYNESSLEAGKVVTAYLVTSGFNGISSCKISSISCEIVSAPPIGAPVVPVDPVNPPVVPVNPPVVPVNPPVVPVNPPVVPVNPPVVPVVPPVEQPQPALSVAQRILELVNKARSESRRCGDRRYAAAAPLTLNDKLNTAAQGHSDYMADEEVMSHTGRNHSNMSQRISNAGYNWRAVAENIARGQNTPEAVMASWLRSSGHCSNIMSDEYTELGVGFNNSSSSGPYWTQNFGRAR